MGEHTIDSLSSTFLPSFPLSKTARFSEKGRSGPDGEWQWVVMHPSTGRPSEVEFDKSVISYYKYSEALIDGIYFPLSLYSPSSLPLLLLLLPLPLLTLTFLLLFLFLLLLPYSSSSSSFFRFLFFFSASPCLPLLDPVFCYFSISLSSQNPERTLKDASSLERSLRRVFHDSSKKSLAISSNHFMIK
jgi:hypothetical protein